MKKLVLLVGVVHVFEKGMNTFGEIISESDF